MKKWILIMVLLRGSSEPPVCDSEGVPESWGWLVAWLPPFTEHQGDPNIPKYQFQYQFQYRVQYRVQYQYHYRCW